MNDDEMLSAGCAGALIIVALLVIVLILKGIRPFTYQKKTDGGTTMLTVTAKRNLNRVSVLAKFGSNESVTFERRRIRKGQGVEFVYPASKAPARLTVEVESGYVRVFDV
jgi:hypothetical protein